MPFVFASFAMNAVGVAGGQGRRGGAPPVQGDPGPDGGHGAKPDYRTCVDIVTQSALRLMVAPALIPAVIPIARRPRCSAPQALGGLLIGSIVSGVCVGDLDDDRRRRLGQRQEVHRERPATAARAPTRTRPSVTGDTVGDPYKDTAGPAINPMLKLVNIVALLIIPFLVAAPG